MVTARYRIKKGSLSSLIFSSHTEYKTSSGSEQLLYQETVDFDLLDASFTTIKARITALTKQAAGSGTYFVRVGGTENVADGTIFVSFVTSHAAYLSAPDSALGASLAKPVGPKLVKITGASGAFGTLAFIKAFEVVCA